MNRACTAGLMVASLVLAGCGGSAGESTTAFSQAPSAAPSPSPSPAALALTKAQLQAALLVAADVPAGYLKQPDQPTPSASPSEAPLEGKDAACSKKFADLDKGADATAEAEATFQTAKGDLIQQSLESYADDSGLAANFDEARAVITECNTFTDSSDGEKTEFTLATLPSFPKVGDDSVGLAVTGKTAGFTIKLNIVIVRLGRNVAYFGQGGLSEDIALLESITRKGLSKLEAAG